MVKANVIKYLKSLNENERKKLKVMLDNEVMCCIGLSRDLNIDPYDFNTELRRVLCKTM